MARRIPGEFVPSDVNLANDPAIMRAGAWAELLFRRANEYAKRMKRDGVIHRCDLSVISIGITGRAANHADALVRAGDAVVADSRERSGAGKNERFHDRLLRLRCVG